MKILTTFVAFTLFTLFTCSANPASPSQQSGLAEKNLAAGKAFMEENRKKEGVIELPNGLQYRVINAGSGPKPKATDTVSVRYRGTLIDGSEFDSSARTDKPASFRVSSVIKGWQEAIQIMPQGSKWQIVIPPALGYGEQGAGSKIGPNETMVFDIELVEISGAGSTKELARDKAVLGITDQAPAQAKAQYKMVECSKLGISGDVTVKQVFMFVPRTFDVSRAVPSGQYPPERRSPHPLFSLLDEAVSFARAQCPSRKVIEQDTTVFVYYDDEPASQRLPSKVPYVDDYEGSSLVALRIQYGASNYIWDIKNHAFDTRAQKEAAEQRVHEEKIQKERQRAERAAIEATRAKEYTEARERLTAFWQRYSVTEWGNFDKLRANPFAYEGNVIALILRFDQMITPTTGVFNGDIVVTDIPRATFTNRAKILLAGKVLGNTELKVPLAGTMVVPKLGFVGVHFCQKDGCEDINPSE